MNVRETPNGAKKDVISNRAHVRPLRFASAAAGKQWAYVSDISGREIGWVFSPYLTLQRSRNRVASLDRSRSPSAR